MAGTSRQAAIRKALRETAPMIPLADAEPVLQRALSGTLKNLPPSIALWLALTSHVRHRHTEYDTLLDQGYDRDAARHFVAGETDAILSDWGCRRSVLSEDEQISEDSRFKLAPIQPQKHGYRDKPDKRRLSRPEHERD